FVLYFADGIGFEADLVDLAVENKLIERSGSWFSYGDTKLGQGRDRARVYLEENPAIAQEIKQKILQIKCLPTAAPAADTETAAASEDE
ncbi:MAG: DNA recombination/repair protein RecA, partial [Planctomycetaceae bacterium]|nr:DNA recombination/repair protein RecA [Planctomycetaceae bacterium]